jgi:hypothetical protein
MALFEYPRLIFRHFFFWCLPARSVSAAEVGKAMDDARRRFPNDRLTREARALADFDRREIKADHRFDA